MTQLHETAMLVSLSVKQWTARKLDKKITDQVNREHSASQDAGRYNKLLLSKDALAEINKAESQARVEHYSRTLPWSKGTDILSAAGYLDYQNTMREIKQRFNSAVDVFCDNWDAHVEDARQRLNGMFDASDYPTVDRIRKRFDFAVEFFPIPSAGDFRVALVDGQADQIRREIEASTAKRIEQAQQDIFERVSTVVAAMVEKLGAYDPSGDKVTGIFRDSLVGNVRDLVALLPTLNITGDNKISDLTTRLEKELCEFDATDLRESDNLRQKTKDAAAKILADVTEFMA